MNTFSNYIFQSNHYKHLDTDRKICFESYSKNVLLSSNNILSNFDENKITQR